MMILWLFTGTKQGNVCFYALVLDWYGTKWDRIGTEGVDG